MLSRKQNCKKKLIKINRRMWLNLYATKKNDNNNNSKRINLHWKKFFQLMLNYTQWKNLSVSSSCITYMMMIMRTLTQTNKQTKKTPFNHHLKINDFKVCWMNFVVYRLLWMILVVYMHRNNNNKNKEWIGLSILYEFLFLFFITNIHLDSQSMDFSFHFSLRILFTNTHAFNIKIEQTIITATTFFFYYFFLFFSKFTNVLLHNNKT